MIAEIVLPFFGQGRRIRGGPFDEYAAPAIGVCLEAGSAKAGLAAVAMPVDDYAAPTAEQFVEGLAAVLRAMRAAPELPVYVGCRAGLGRTGTVIAGLARMAGQEDGVAWVRRYYDARAVETPAQEDAVRALDVAKVWRLVGEAG